jgi:hypothetical protein
MQLQPHAFALPQKIGNKKQVVVTEWGTQKVHQGKIAALFILIMPRRPCVLVLADQVKCQGSCTTEFYYFGLNMYATVKCCYVCVL